MTKSKLLKDWCIENKKEYILKEWDFEKNTEFDINTVHMNLSTPVWWKCEKNHSWLTTVNTRKVSGCPICSNRQVLTGYNDVATTRPDIAAVWHPTKNGDLKPTDIVAGSTKVIWFKCKEEHEWSGVLDRVSRINDELCPYCAGRQVLTGYNDLATTHPEIAKDWHPTKNGNLKPTDISQSYSQKVWWKCSRNHERHTLVRLRIVSQGCPVCPKQKNKSLPEYIIHFFLEKEEPIIHNYTDLGFELDLYIPSKKIAIEYDGHRFHENQEEKDKAKNQKCKENGIIIYRLREAPLPSLNDYSIDIPVKRGDAELESAISKLIQLIYNKKTTISIADNISEINNIRTLKEIANSFAALYPEQAAEWHPTKNGDLKPTEIPPYSKQKAWWRCKNNHEWISTVSNRTFRNCPYCTGQRPIVGENDLATLFPDLIKEWNYERNKKLTPDQVSSHGNRKVWWKCSKCNHEWQASISHRTGEKTGCPACAGKVVIPGFNDLATTHPHLSAQWHPIKNGDLKPTDVTFGSDKKVWWQCIDNPLHEWEAPIQPRTRYLSKTSKGETPKAPCPVCSGRILIKGVNDMGTTHPNLAAQWHPTKNGNLTPSDVTARTNKKIWWICDKNHEWDAVGNSRQKETAGCPYCAGKKLYLGFNDIESQSPEIAKEWNSLKNGNVKPSQVTIHSCTKVWWKCSKCNYEWQTSPSQRTKGIGCPCCAGKVLVAGINDITTSFPDIKKYWDYEKNKELELSPEMFKITSKDEAYFIFDGESIKTKIHNAVLRIKYRNKISKSEMQE